MFLTRSKNHIKLGVTFKQRFDEDKSKSHPFLDRNFARMLNGTLCTNTRTALLSNLLRKLASYDVSGVNFLYKRFLANSFCLEAVNRWVVSNISNCAQLTTVRKIPSKRPLSGES